MKSLKEIKESLIRDGAIVRLQDLNREREILLEIIERDERSNKKAREVIESVNKVVQANKKRGYKYKGKHWTQTVEGRARITKHLRKLAAAKKKS
jgi:hypothetical protein